MEKFTSLIVNPLPFSLVAWQQAGQILLSWELNVLKWKVEWQAWKLIGMNLAWIEQQFGINLMSRDHLALEKLQVYYVWHMHCWDQPTRKLYWN